MQLHTLTSCIKSAGASAGHHREFVSQKIRRRLHVHPVRRTCQRVAMSADNHPVIERPAFGSGSLDPDRDRSSAGVADRGRKRHAVTLVARPPRPTADREDHSPKIQQRSPQRSQRSDENTGPGGFYGQNTRLYVRLHAYTRIRDSPWIDNA